MQVKMLAPFTVAVLLAGCAKPPPPPPPPPAPMRLLPHLGPPVAALCKVAPYSLAEGGTARIEMTISNEGGYCAAAVTNAAGKPYAAPLVPAKPEHGEDEVVQYNGTTSIEYFVTQPGYTGPDGFTVKLIAAPGKPGFTTATVVVTVVGKDKAASGRTSQRASTLRAG